jgi:predicted DCC family thiol-disulfide oxidoreductase YuxK
MVEQRLDEHRGDVPGGGAAQRAERGKTGADTVCLGNAGVAASPLTVLYDGACPLCRREIGVYRGLPSAQPLCFRDVSDPSASVPEGATRAQLLARFHVLQADGRLLSGAQAFLALWSGLPGWRWISRAGRLPGVAWCMECAYRGFLWLRPALQRWAARLDGPRAGR